jgi:hypothetical protein
MNNMVNTSSVWIDTNDSASATQGGPNEPVSVCSIDQKSNFEKHLFTFAETRNQVKKFPRTDLRSIRATWQV